MKIHVLTTGGTIDKFYFDQKDSFQVGEPQIGQLLREANVTVEHEIRALMHKDSLDLTDEDRESIVAAVRDTPGERFLITHGTDTMLRTAELLQSRVQGKVMVLTGAMQPARLRSSDAFFNIGFAFAAVQRLEPGAYVAMNGRIFLPGQARKNVEEGRFEET
ncbi:MAG: asparaginase domain-containing protein [Usitatibacter sp.]